MITLQNVSKILTFQLNVVFDCGGFVMIFRWSNKGWKDVTLVVTLAMAIVADFRCQINNIYSYLSADIYFYCQITKISANTMPVSENHVEC